MPRSRRAEFGKKGFLIRYLGTLREDLEWSFSNTWVIRPDARRNADRQTVGLAHSTGENIATRLRQSRRGGILLKNEPALEVAVKNQRLTGG